MFRTSMFRLCSTRRYGLKITAHVGELPDHVDSAATIAFGPERYGHAIIMTQELLSRLSRSRSRGVCQQLGFEYEEEDEDEEGNKKTTEKSEPRQLAMVEICPTSNLRTLELGTDDTSHHPTLHYWFGKSGAVAVGPWAAQDRPRVTICTDDTALFGITLSDELAAVAIAYKLTPAALVSLTLGAFDCMFMEDGEALRAQAEAVAAELLNEWSALDYKAALIGCNSKGNKL